MAEFYCDISAIGNEYQAYADTPTTWGVPQDGNGKAGPGHSAAVAIATIDCASASASGAGSLSLLGQTVSSTLTGSGATLATNIAAAINAYATAVTATYSALLLPLNKLVYARVNPGLNTQVQIMLRIAGADWNGMVPASAGTWGTAPTMGAFAGGANGPFAYLMKDSTVFGQTLGNYGQFTFAASAGVTNNVDTDITHVRTKRAGANLSASFTSAAASYWWAKRNFLFDDGTKWNDGSSSGGKLTFTLRTTNSNSSSLEFKIGSSNTLALVSRSEGNFEFAIGAAGATVSNVIAFSLGGSSSKTIIKKCRLVETSDSIGAGNTWWTDNGNSVSGFLDATDNFFQSRSTAKVMGALYGSSSTGRITLNGSVHEVVAATGPIGKIAHLSGVSSSGYIDWIGGRIYDSNGVYRCVSPFQLYNNTSSSVEAVCDGVVGVTDASVGFVASMTGRSRLYWSSPEGPNRGFRYEDHKVVVDWKDDGTFPDCGAPGPWGGTWSHRITWGQAPSMWQAVTPLKLSFFYRSAAASKMVTLELYTPDATTIYQDEIELTINYLDSSDVWRTETRYGIRLDALGSRAALAASAKSWTSNGVASYSAKKVEITTAYAIKSGSEVMMRFSLCAYRATPITIYASPELGVS